MSFLISALPKAQFDHLFEMNGAELSAAGAMRVTADNKPGFPCRVSLQDAEPGEELLLIHYEHQPAHSPFQASHAIFVRTAAQDLTLAPGEVPEMLRLRMLSLRGFDDAGMLRYAELADGMSLETSLEKLLSKPGCEYVQIHFAAPGCYAARADRL